MKEKKMQNPVKGRKIVWPGQIICGGGVFGLMTWCWREKATHSCSSMTYRWPEKFFKKKKEKKKKNSSNTHGLISIVLLLQKMKQQLCEMWFRNSSSCLLLSILTMWIVLDVDLSFPQAGKELYFPFGACPPSKTAPSYISMNNDFID